MDIEYYLNYSKRVTRMSEMWDMKNVGYGQL